MSKGTGNIARRLTQGSQPGRARTGQGGRFRKGHAKKGGRRAGVENIVTRELKDAILNAAIRHGADGKGKDGLDGYMLMLAREERKIFGTLLCRLLPMQVKASINTLVNIKYKTLEEATAEAIRLGLPERRVYELKDYSRTEDRKDEPPAA